MKISMLKKLLSCLFAFAILLSSTTVYADDKDLANMQAGNSPLPTLKTVYSIEELSEYLSTYRIKYAKDKDFCTYREHSPKMGEFYNNLDCIYFPSNVDPKLITRIDLCVYDVYIYFKKNEKATENTQIRWMFSEDSTSFDSKLKRLGDNESAKGGNFAEINKFIKNRQPNVYNELVTLYDLGVCDIKKAYVSDVPILSEGHPSFPRDKDIAPDESLKVDYNYELKNFGYEFDIGGNLPDRDLGYKYCDLIKVPIAIKKDLSAGEACYEKSERLN